MKYEYVAVKIGNNAPKGVREDDHITEQINAVAGHGWRMIEVLPAGQYGGGHAIFEREVSA